MDIAPLLNSARRAMETTADQKSVAAAFNSMRKVAAYYDLTDQQRREARALSKALKAKLGAHPRRCRGAARANVSSHTVVAMIVLQALMTAS
jgi:hypothetical protein